VTFSELKTLLVGWLDDLNYGYFTEPQVENWLNNAQFKVQKMLLMTGENYYMKPVETSLIVHRQDYVLPYDFWKLHRLELVLSGSAPNEDVRRLRPITNNQKDVVNSQTGTPYHYYIKRNRLVLFPIPDAAKTMRLYYSPRVVHMVLGTDVPDVPEHYHELIAIEAALDGFIKDGRSPDLLLRKKAEYEEDLKQSAIERNEDESRGILCVEDDW
jgi:hypothetical protein